MESKLIHDAERKAVETVVDHVLSVKDPEERKKSLLRLTKKRLSLPSAI